MKECSFPYSLRKQCTLEDYENLGLLCWRIKRPFSIFLLSWHDFDILVLINFQFDNSKMADIENNSQFHVTLRHCVARTITLFSGFSGFSVNSMELQSVIIHDVTSAISVSQNNETATMLLSQTRPVGDKLFLMRFLLFQQICIYVGHVSENTLLMSVIESQSIVFYKNIHLYRIYIYIDIYSLLDI